MVAEEGRGSSGAMDGGEAVEAGATPLTEGERHTPLDGPQTPAWLSVARHELDSPLEPSVVEASALRGKLEAAAAETSQLRQRLAAAEERAAEAAEAAAERAAEAAAAASDSASLEGEAAEDAVWQAAAARGREEAVEEVVPGDGYDVSTEVSQHTPSQWGGADAL